MEPFSFLACSDVQPGMEYLEASPYVSKQKKEKPKEKKLAEPKVSPVPPITSTLSHCSTTSGEPKALTNVSKCSVNTNGTLLGSDLSFLIY
jgi:hypothetical protein